MKINFDRDAYNKIFDDLEKFTDWPKYGLDKVIE